MRDLGAIAIGEVPTADEASDALTALNELIGTWKTESLVAYAMQQVETTIASNQYSYSVGPGGDIDCERPIRLDAAYNRDPNINYYAIYIAQSFQEYSDIVAKNVNAQLIMVVYYDPTFPLGTLYVWPKSNDTSYQLNLWFWKSVAEFDDLDEEIVLPPGYNRALRTNLAIELAPRYGREISPALANMAVSSKAQLKRTNLILPIMQIDSRITRQGQSFNYLTGEPQ